MPYADTDKAREYQRDYRRIRRGGDGCTTPVHPAVSVDFRLKTAADVLELLAEQIAAVRAERKAGTLEKARTVGYLAAIALKAIETGNMAARLEMLEMVLKSRNGNNSSTQTNRT